MDPSEQTEIGKTEHRRLRPSIRLSRMKHCPETSRFRTSLPHQRFSKPQRIPPRSTTASGSTIVVDSAVWQHISCTHSRNGCSAAPEPQTGLNSVSAAHWHSKKRTVEESAGANQSAIKQAESADCSGRLRVHALLFPELWPANPKEPDVCAFQATAHPFKAGDHWKITRFGQQNTNTTFRRICLRRPTRN